MNPDLSNFQNYLAASWPGRKNPRIASFGRLNAGWESDLYAFDLESGSVDDLVVESLILRLYPGDGAQA